MPVTHRQMFEDQTLMHKEASKDSDKATSEISGEVKPLDKVAESERQANRYRGYLLHELICTSGLVWLDAQDKKALRITDGSQRLSMPTQISMWSKLSSGVCWVAAGSCYKLASRSRMILCHEQASQNCLHVAPTRGPVVTSC